jgi:hypothetical protein
MTMSRHISEAIVNAIGVMIHAMRPALPMFAEVVEVVEVVESE